MVELFFVYSHRDEDYRDELEIHLAALKRQGIISTWHDRRITAGEELHPEIGSHLEHAHIILLLVSPYFIASDYCYNVEMKRALERHEQGDARVIPVILRPCDWHDLPFGKLLATPRDGKPISKFPDLHDAFLEVTNAIKVAAQQFAVQSPKSPLPDSMRPRSHPGEAPKPRSSNLRIRRTFTGRDKDKFLREAFEYIANFFEASLSELEVRNRGIQTTFERTGTGHCRVAVYRDGSKVASCRIWLARQDTFRNGVGYRSGDADSDNSFNELLSVEDDNYAMFLKPMGISFRSVPEGKLTPEGGAEFLWSMFIEPLQ